MDLCLRRSEAHGLSALTVCCALKIAPQPVITFQPRSNANSIDALLVMAPFVDKSTKGASYRKPTQRTYVYLRLEQVDN